jgi:hypothetical protein
MADSPQEISALRKRHREILDGKDTFGEGTRQLQAIRFWVENLAKPIIDQARQRLQKTGRLPKVDLLVSVAGFSPETTIITAGVLRPEQILVISSEVAYGMIDIIGEFVMKQGLRLSQFRHESCNPADLSLFELICRRVKSHRDAIASKGSKAEKAETLIDITGGKKVMSAGAAMAAGELDLRICYVDNQYDDSRRAAVPGTEEIVLLDSPYQLYGGAELKRADHDFDMGAFEVARSRYGKLAERLNEPAQARFMRDLSSLYNAWRNLDIDGLKQAMPLVQARLSEPTPIARTYCAQLETQLAFVKRLVEADHAARILTLFLLGEANMEAGRYDFSGLLFYRTIEASIASRLEQRYPGFLCEKPDYTKIDQDVANLAVRLEACAKEVFGKPKNKTTEDASADESAPRLPHAVACMDGALLLRVLGDDLLEKASLREPKALANLGQLAVTRNRSILAHGFLSVSATDCKALRAQALQLLAAYWTLNNESMPFKDAVQELRFLRLGP